MPTFPPPQKKKKRKQFAFQAIASREIKLTGGLYRGRLVDKINRLMIPRLIYVCTTKTKQFKFKFKQQTEKI